MTYEEFLKRLAQCKTGSAEEQAYATSVLKPYRVKNAVLMAAGYGSRLAPLTNRVPKGLLQIRGEILVERQIRQLLEAGIEEIFLVVGHLKEQFSYLASNPHIHIIENPDYTHYNNISSLYRVLDILDNTYICSADNYFTENVFTPYVYRSYYAAVYGEKPTEEYYLTVDKNDRITDVQIGGTCGCYMLGQAYFSHTFSIRFQELLKEAYNTDLSVRELLWEQFYMRHISKLPLYRKCYPSGIIYEFDTVEDIRAFDFTFIC